MLLSFEILIFFTSTWIPLTVSQNLVQWVFQGLLSHQEIYAISDSNFDGKLFLKLLSALKLRT